MSKKEVEYMRRLQDRADLLSVRIETTELRDKSEMLKELHALEWAIERANHCKTCLSKAAKGRVYLEGK